MCMCMCMCVCLCLLVCLNPAILVCGAEQGRQVFFVGCIVPIFD